MNKRIFYIFIAVLFASGVGSILLSFRQQTIPVVSENPKYGGDYVYAIEDKINTLDPRLAVWLSSKNAISLIFDPLISVTKDFTLAPRICQIWKMSSDNRIFECTIKKGIKFHNGDELTSKDVVFSLNYYARPGSLDLNDFQMIEGADDYWSGKRKYISGIRAKDDYTLQINLKDSFPNFISIIASPRFVILPNELMGLKEETFFKRPIGSGPFKFVSYDGNVLEVSSNSNYFLGRPYLDRVFFKKMSYDEAAEGFKNGTVNDISSYESDESIRDYPNAKLLLNYSYKTTIIFLNNSRYPFTNLKNRQIILNNIPRSDIIKICNPHAILAESVIPKGILGYDNYSLNVENSYPYADEKESFKGIVIYYEKSGLSGCSADVLNKHFLGLNIPIRFVEMEPNELAKRFFSGDLYGHVETVSVKNEDAYTMLKYFESTNAENLPRINDKTIDALLHKALLTDDTVAKSEIYKTINKRILDNAYALPILYPTNYAIVDSRYRGNENRVLTQYVDFSKIWKEKD